MSNPEHSNQFAADVIGGILDSHVHAVQSKGNTMSAPYRVQPRALAGRGNNTTGLANGQPGEVSPKLRDAINTLLTALGADPLPPELPEAEMITALEGLAHGLEGAADESGDVSAAAMSNRSPRQRVAAMNNQESRVEIAKRIAARHGKRWEDVIRFVP